MVGLYEGLLRAWNPALLRVPATGTRFSESMTLPLRRRPIKPRIKGVPYSRERDGSAVIWANPTGRLQQLLGGVAILH